VDCYIWYSEKGTGRGPCSPPSPLVAVFVLPSDVIKNDDCVERAKGIMKLFSASDSHSILVFPYQS